MNHSKILLLAGISGFVALTTAWLGVGGTIIGSVISSLLYNTLSELLEKPVTERKFSFNFEYEIAYVFPLVVIAFIQLLLLAAFLAQWGYLPGTFLNAYLKIQGVVDNNLYRILGCALVVMGVYPFVIKPNIVKKSYGVIVAFVGLIFLARGFVDSHIALTELYGKIFQIFDFPIEIFAFLLLAYVIILILNNASHVHKDFKLTRNRNLGNLELTDVISEKESKMEPSYRNSPKNIRVNKSETRPYMENDNPIPKKYPRPQKNHHFSSNRVKAVKNPRFSDDQSSQNGENYKR